jgi:hypothetical protein
MYFEPDPFTGYRLKPGSTGYFQKQIPAQVNKNGHRNELVSVEKMAGISRVLVLGDSFTVGANVEQEQSYAEVLEKLLLRNNQNPVEVINTGVGGWGPLQYAQYYEHYGQDYSPDLIMVGFFVGNDTYLTTTDTHQLRTAILGRRISRQAASGRFIRLKIFMYNYSNIARLILNKGPTLRDVTRQHCSDFSDQFLVIQRRRMRNHLVKTHSLERKMRISIGNIQKKKKLAERDSIPLIVILIPDENQVNRSLQKALLTDEEIDRLDFDMPQSLLKELFAEADILIIDLLPFFREDSRCLYMNDTHWTPEGHALVAAVIYENISNKLRQDLTGHFSK